MIRVLVTGGAGFIGSNLVQALLRRGDAVRVVDDFSTGRKENLRFSHMAAEAAARLEIVEGDVGDPDLCASVVRNVDYVLHQAAIPSVPRSVEEPLRTNRVNVDGTLNLLVAARDGGVRRVVFASSSAVYGNAPGFPRKESTAPDPLSPYAVQKLTAENYLRVFYNLYGLETVALRYFNVFGPHQDPESEYAAVIPRFIKALLTGRRPAVYGDGEQSRDFTYVRNVVHGNILAMEAEGAPGKVMNLACGERLTLNTLLDMLRSIMGTDVEAHYTDPRPGDVRHSHADISLAEKILGFQVQVTAEEGLSKTVEYFRVLFDTPEKDRPVP